MSRDHICEIVLAALAIVFLVVAVVLYSRQATFAEELNEATVVIAELHEQIDAMTNDDAQGGAEIDLPDPIAQDTKWTWPIAQGDYRFKTSPFGERDSPIDGVARHHQGLDINGLWRARVVASADGVVVPANEWIHFTDGPSIQGGHWPAPDGHYKGHPVHGGLIVIRHDDGWYTLYSHLHETRVHGGQQVVAGQVIGRQGQTGLSTGEHLHFGLINPDGKHVNPLYYVEEPQAKP